MLFVIYACKCQFSFALKAISSIFYPRRSFFSHHANWIVPSFLSVNRNKPINSASLSFIQKTGIFDMGLRCQIYRWIYSIDMPAKSFLFLEINLRFYLTPLGISWKNTCLRKYPCLLVFRLYCSIQIFGKSLSARLFFKWFVLFDNSVFVLFFFFSSCSWQHSL